MKTGFLVPLVAFLISFSAASFSSPSEIETSFKYNYKADSGEFKAELDKLKAIYEIYEETDSNASSVKSVCGGGLLKIRSTLESYYDGEINLNDEFELSASPIKNVEFYLKGVPSSAELEVKCVFRGRFKEANNNKITAEYLLSEKFSVSGVTKNERVFIKVR